MLAQPDIKIRSLGQQPYEQTWRQMREFTEQRDAETPDELWLVEHPPVYTQGLNGNPEHLLHPNPEIPIIQTDRGGQVTYHGPGQIILYLLIDLKRRRLGVRALVSLMENAIIQLLDELGISAQAREDAPGVYVDERKIASLGLKIRKQRSYHGLALNVDMDLTPFTAIHPCGLINMKMAQISDFIANPNQDQLQQRLTDLLIEQLLNVSNTSQFK